MKYFLGAVLSLWVFYIGLFSLVEMLENLGSREEVGTVSTVNFDSVNDFKYLNTEGRMLK